MAHCAISTPRLIYVMFEGCQLWFHCNCVRYAGEDKWNCEKIKCKKCKVCCVYMFSFKCLRVLAFVLVVLLLYCC